MSANIFELIKETVPIHDLLDEAGVKYLTREKNCKVSCPIHGADNRKSAFIYVDTGELRCFTCNKSWDVISFWAEVNEWWKVNDAGEDVLDIGKAVASLKEKYDVEYTQPTWEQLYRDLKGTIGPAKGYAGYQLSERKKLASYYLWRVSQRLSKMSKEARAECWPAVMGLWNSMEDMDLSRDDWKDELNRWQEQAGRIGA